MRDPFAGLLGLGFGAFLAAFLFVSVEISGLLGEEALGLICNILARFNSFFTREVETAFAGEGTERAKPLLGFFGQSFERGTHVGVAVGILVEIGTELIHERGNVL